TFNEIESCDIILKLDKNDQDKNKIVEINLNIPNNRFFAKDQSESFEIAFDKAIDQIKKQLVKHKEKVYEKY
ncbi:MAG: HPF/RaiA family ribosome-associated protein, partial [Bacteroidia bacterium]